MPHEIKSIHLFIACDEEGEGLAAFMSGDQWIPMVAADEDRVASLKPIAKEIAQLSGKTIKLVRLSERTEVEVITPG